MRTCRGRPCTVSRRRRWRRDPPRPAAPAEVAAPLADLDIDAADVIASCSKVFADECRLDNITADSYHIEHTDDRQLAEEDLGREFTADETRALEGCIRHYLRTGKTS